MDLRREDFISQYPPLNYMNKDEVKDLWRRDVFHLYIHIPFCIKKCGFCYYKSIASPNGTVPDEYVTALKKEIQAYASMPEIQSRDVRSLYIGGGTPTLLSEEQLEFILSLVMKSFHFTSDFEFCCEAYPGPETTLSKINVLKSFGLHRLSLGCQSLDEEVLKANGSNHETKEFYKVFELARKASVRTINVDLMSGLVDQSIESFMDTINKIVVLSPENISIYKMEVYLNSSIYKRLRQGSITLISDEEEIKYVRKGYARLLEMGYSLANHFNFMISQEHDHIQRRGLWDGEDMLGVGASAHSCMNLFMFQDEPRIEHYIEMLNRGEMPVVRAHEISKKEDMVQRAVLGLKNLKICRTEFLKDYGMDIMDVFPKQFRMLEREGFVNIKDNAIESTFEGALFADDIARELYLPEHKNMMLGHVKRSIS